MKNEPLSYPRFHHDMALKRIVLQGSRYYFASLCNWTVDYTRSSNLECNTVPNLTFLTLSEAIADCTENVLCGMVLDSCGNSTNFHVCQHSSEKIESSCGSVLYQKSKYKIVISPS